jgi:hypothetical protein
MVRGTLLFLLLLIIGAWFIMRPGVFFIQPSDYASEGVILIYYNKPAGMPVFTSPESLCLSAYGSVNSTCLEDGYDTATLLSQNLITRLPFADWAYDLFLPRR